MNYVEAGRASIEEGSDGCYIFNASLILSRWHRATELLNLIYCYHIEVGVEYSNQISTKKHHELGDFKHMMDEAYSRFIIKEAFTA